MGDERFLCQCAFARSYRTGRSHRGGRAVGVMLPERISARIQHLLASVPDPETAERYLLRLQGESASAFGRIAASPAALRAALHLFSYSRFLSDSVLRSPERILQVANSGAFYRAMEAEEFEE